MELYYIKFAFKDIEVYNKNLSMLNIDKPRGNTMRALVAYKKDCKIEKIETEEEKEINKKKIDKEINKKIKVRHAVLDPKKSKRNKKRGTIKSFSKETQKRIKFFMNNNKINYKSMITLTYPAELIGKLNGKEVKYQLNRFTKRFNLNNYVWVLEFQKNTNPHFHIMTDNEYKKANNEEISKIWYEIVGSKLEKHLKAGTRNEKLRNGKDGASSYIRKYVSKKEQKKIPENYQNCGKLWGKGGKEKELEKEIISINEEVIENAKEIYLDLLNESLKKKNGMNPKTFERIENMKYPILWNLRKEIL